MTPMRAWALLLGAILTIVCACESPHAVEPATSRVANDPVTLRIVSANIRHGAGMDGVVDLDRNAAVLAALDPDLVLLQEIDVGVARSGGVDQARFLADELGMESTFARFMPHDGGEYGLALLSRFPIIAAERIELPPGRLEPRSVARILVDVPGAGELAVVGAHLDWLDDDEHRFAQATALIEALERRGDGVDRPLIVGGDLNDVPGSRTIDAFDRFATRLAPIDDAPTYPADEPEISIDHLLVRPATRWKRREASVVNERVASDHRPVLLVLELADDALAR